MQTVNSDTAKAPIVAKKGAVTVAGSPVPYPINAPEVLAMLPAKWGYTEAVIATLNRADAMAIALEDTEKPSGKTLLLIVRTETKDADIAGLVAYMMRYDNQTETIVATGAAGQEVRAQFGRIDNCPDMRISFHAVVGANPKDATERGTE